MNNGETILDLARYGLIAIFILVVIYIIGIVIVGGFLYPQFTALAPANTTNGISPTTYLNIDDNLWWGLKTGLYILIGGVFVFILFKALYERETTSATWGG